MSVTHFPCCCLRVKVGTLLLLPYIGLVTSSLSSSTSNLIDADLNSQLRANLQSPTSDSRQAKEARNVLKRILPPDKDQLFAIHVDRDLKALNSGKDLAILNSRNASLVVVKATSGVVAVWGIHQYLKYECHCHLSWEFREIHLPESLPWVSNLTFRANDLVRYYQNVCNYGYGFVWWAWEDWEKHLDWMALNGVNLVLAQSGQEFIWQDTFTRFGMSPKEVQAHFTGPAFLPWNRMGNLHSWGGPLPSSWIETDRVLQGQILERIRSLGMIPIAPAFNGIVPERLIELHLQNSSSSYERLRQWGHFPESYTSSYLLNPDTSLFKQIGGTFLALYQSEYGTDHFFALDTFNEQSPPKTDLTYLANYAQTAFDSLATMDPVAIWAMQGWMFRDLRYWTVPRARALLEAIPAGRVLVLDLASTTSPQFGRLESYFNQPFVYSMLHNYGGYIGMYGKVDTINWGTFKARHSYPSMVGLGLTNEGMHTSYAVYDFFLEMGWRSEPVKDVQSWFAHFAERRYRGGLADSLNETMRDTSLIVNYNGDSPKEFAAMTGSDPPSTTAESAYRTPNAMQSLAWQLLAKSVFNCCSHFPLTCPSTVDDLPEVPLSLRDHLSPTRWRRSPETTNSWWLPSSRSVATTTFDSSSPTFLRGEERGGHNDMDDCFRFHGKTLLTQLPRANLKSRLWYDEKFLVQAWDLLLASTTQNRGQFPATLTQGPLAYDVVDLTRQVLTNLLYKKYSQIMNAIAGYQSVARSGYHPLSNSSTSHNGSLGGSETREHYFVFHDATTSTLSATPAPIHAPRPSSRGPVNAPLQVVPIQMNTTSSITTSSRALEIAIRDQTREFLGLVKHLDRLLGSSKFFLLGHWLQAARDRAGQNNPYEAMLYEFNARNQVTLWGPSGNILDYAAKQWSGLIQDYYLPRWRLYFSWIRRTWARSGRMPRREGVFKRLFLRKIGIPFTFRRNAYPTEAKGNPFEIAKELHTKYRSQML